MNGRTFFIHVGMSCSMSYISSKYSYKNHHIVYKCDKFLNRESLKCSYIFCKFNFFEGICRSLIHFILN